jgi:acyl transferase domain-containing protein
VVDSREQLIEALAAYLAGNVGAAVGPSAIHVGGQAESAAFNSFTSGSAGDVLIDTFVRERDLEKIAMFWAYGGSVPWHALHPRRRPIVPLPGYPFARERCWVPAAPQAAEVRGAPPRAVRTLQTDGGRAVPILHPMLHVNSSDLAECRFSTRFDGDELYAVRDNVRGLRLIPAAVYFEMMRAAIAELVGRAHRAGERGTIRLTDVAWYGPRDIDAEPVTLHVGLRAAGSNRIECEVYSLPDGQGNAPAAADADARTLHCRATAWLTSSPGSLESIDLPELRARATGQITTAQWYEALTRIGFEYGPAYAETGIVRSGTGDDGRGFFVAELNASPDPDVDRYGLPPLVLNTALQAASLLIAGVGSKDDGSVAALPTAYRCRELTLLAPLPAAVVVHVHDASSASGDGEAALVDIDICDEAGSLLVRFAGVGGLDQPVAGGAGDGGPPAKREFNATPLRMLANRDIVAPRNALEETLQEIWQEVIGFAPIGVFDHFLDIGGNSLIATQVIMRTNEYYQVDLQASALLVPEANIAYCSTLVVAELARQASESV